MNNSLSQDDALDIVKTILGINANDFMVATINIRNQKDTYIKVRDSIALKIVESLGFGTKNE